MLFWIFYLKCIYQNEVDQLELSWAHRGMFSAPMDELCCTNLYYLFRDSSRHLFCMYLKYVYGYFLGFAATILRPYLQQTITYKFVLVIIHNTI